MLSGFVVSACQTTGLSARLRGDAPNAADASKDTLAELVSFGNRVRQLGEKQLEQQYRQLVFANNAGYSSEAAIKLALLLSVPNSNLQDIDQATHFLRDVVYREADDSPDIAAFARLIYNLLKEDDDKATNRNMALAMLTRERDRNEQLSGELAKAQSALTQERKQKQTLEGQLEALKRLEEQLSRENITH